MLIDRVKLLCKEKNISLRKLEIEVGLSSSSISKWAKSSPSIDTLQKVADYFEVSLDYLAENTEYRTPQEQLEIVYNVDVLHKEMGLIETSKYSGVDFQKRLEHLLVILEQTDGRVVFGGETLDRHTRELFTISLENLINNTKKNFVSEKRRGPV